MSNDKKRPDWVQKFMDDQEHFDKEVYPKMTFDEKVAWWGSSLHGQMRWQSESGYDAYVQFTPEWHQKMLDEDSDFDLIMNAVFDRIFKSYWDKNEYLKRIGKM